MTQSVLKTKFISHGTLGSKDLEATRRFYEEFLGLEVVRTSPVSLMIRLGGNHVYAVVYTKKKERMPRVYHNGLDVDTDAEVDEAWRACTEQAGAQHHQADGEDDPWRHHDQVASSHQPCLMLRC